MENVIGFLACLAVPAYLLFSGRRRAVNARKRRELEYGRRMLAAQRMAKPIQWGALRAH